MREYALEDALQLFDTQDATRFSAAPAAGDAKEQANGYHYYPQGGHYDKIKEVAVDWADEKARIVKVYFYQWVVYETFYRASNPLRHIANPDAAARLQELAATLPAARASMVVLDPTAEILTFDAGLAGELRQLFGDGFTGYPFKRKLFYSAVLSGNYVFAKGLSPCQKSFSIQFKTGDFDAKNTLWTGMVQSMKEPVLYYNKALTELMFIIGANSKGGVMYEKGSIEDVQRFEQNYAKTDAAIEVGEGALAEGRIRPKRETYQASGYENILQLSNSSISDVNGINPAFLGSSDNPQETGVLHRQRIRQVVSSLACYFDSITLYQKQQARLLLDFLRIYAQNNDGSLFRIVSDDGRNLFLRIAADKFAADYDVSLAEAPTTPEEKQEQAALLTGIGDKLLQAGDATSARTLYALAVKYLALSAADAQRIQQILLPPTPPSPDPNYVKQLEAQLQTLTGQANQTALQKTLSDITLNLAKAHALEHKSP